MAILRPTWQDIITEHNVQTWQDWPWDTWMGPYVVISPRRYRVRVRVYRAGEWVDITSRVASGVIRESNDQPVATLELRLLNGREYPSLAPRRRDSSLNRVNGEYVPLLWIGRLIAVEAAFSEDGSEPDEWWPVFLGELEDEIDTESTERGTYVRLFCRDMAARLQRAYIAGPWSFENMYASQMIQAILDRAYSEGLIQEPVTVRLVGADDFWVERYDVEYTDLWSALQRFCQQRGTDLRHRLNEATGQIELTYWLPDRAMVPGWIIDASQIRREDLRISGTDIINKVTVRYRDAATGQRAEVTVQDADSIAMYGLRHGLIEEPDTDLIPDAATAQKLAQTIVEDLKDVPALTRLTVPFDPRIQLFDKLRVANPNVRDEPEDYAVEARELSFTATDWSMVLVGGARVVVKRQVWLERLATEGVKAPFTPRDTVTARGMSKPTGVAVTSISGGIAVRFDPPVGEEYMRWWESEVHISTQANFAPGPATKVASGRYTYFELTQGLQPNTTYYVRIIHVDMSLNKSEPSDVASGQIAPITERIIDPSLFSIVPTSDPAPSSGSLEDLWDMDPNTGVTFPSAPIAITFRYPVYQGSDLVELHLGAAAQGYVQMRQRDTGQWVNVLGSPASPVQFSQGWNRVPFTGNRLYFGREYRLVLLNNVRVNELRFERVTVADKILAGTLRLTGDMAIVNEEGTVRITSTGIEMEVEEEGGTQWTPGGLVFRRPDGTRSGYLRAIVPGVAEDGDYVPLNFTNEPVIVLSPARAIMYEPSVGGIQKLRLEATNVSHEGFQVVAKLVRHDAPGNRIVFPPTQKYRWWSSSAAWCTDDGHTTESDARAWSEHRLVTTGSSKIFTIGPGATGAIVRIREMLHAHANAGVYHAVNTITYLVRIREVGQSTWLQTRGPYTRSIDTKSSLLSTSFKWSHNVVSHIFSGLPPGEYEIEVTITNKTIRSGEGRNGQESCTLIVEEIEEMTETEIQLPEPITVHYVAFESDNPGGEEGD